MSIIPIETVAEARRRRIEADYRRGLETIHALRSSMNIEIQKLRVLEERTAQERRRSQRLRSHAHLHPVGA